jgi:ribosome-associated toxin RatA of RatAB toxin-antitoxin module
MNRDSLSTADETLKTEDVLLTVLKLEGRQRRVEATIHLSHSVERVWQVLTDYEKLAEFIPNLSKSCRIPHPEGGIRIEQVGVQNLRIVTFSARVVLDMTEEFQSAVRFQMVEGDFKAFSGAWLLQPMPKSESGGTRLTYCLEVWPKPVIPVIAIEQRLRKDLPANLRAIREQLDRQVALIAQH